VAAARRDPPHVVGDGVHSVRELVEIVNADPRRGSGHATSLTKIRLDDIARATERVREFGSELVSDPGVIPVKFRAPGGTLAELVPVGRYQR